MPVISKCANVLPVLGRHAFLPSLLALSVVLIPSAAAPQRSPPSVLFICQFGTAKSAIAREVFRRRARERGIEATTFSRGITPEEHVSPALRQRLEADGVDSTRDGLHRLSKEDLKAADIVVTFNPLPAGMHRTHTLDWSALPSMNDAYPLARANLQRRIDHLLDRIVQGHRR